MPESGPQRQPGWFAELEARPKAELHLHLRGAIPRQFLSDRVRKYPPARALESAPPNQLARLRRQPAIARILAASDPAEELDGLFRFDSLDQFLAAYFFTVFFVREIDDFRSLVSGVREHLRAQNITYAEVTVSIPEYLQQGLPLEGILEVLGDDPPARPEAALDRGSGAELRTWTRRRELLERLLPVMPPTVVGLTLGGAEHLYPPRQFERAYALARDAGLGTTVHAGEALGPESVWQALDALRVERIGHGVRAIEDPRLVSHLAERKIPLEICPTSNVRTGVYRSMEAHPVRELYEAGVPMSISTGRSDVLRCLASRGAGRTAKPWVHDG